MQFSEKVEEYAVDNQFWLGSRHGTDVARTVTIDGAALAAAGFEGHVPSGVPLKKEGDKWAPVTGTGDVLEGFVLVAQAFDGSGDVVAPMLDRGRVRASRLPEGAFDVSTLASQNPLFVIQED